MSNEQAQVAVFEGDIPIFEQNGRPNGYTTWSAKFVAQSLGYKNLTSFKPVIARAQQVLLTLGIDVTEHFRQEVSRDTKGKEKVDYRLTRFACYLTAMAADTKKVPVARAQVYFARFSEECQRHMDDPGPIERVLIRKEVSKHERTLSQTAARAGVEDYAMFRNAGYLGLYYMNVWDVKKLKGVPDDRTPLDFMGQEELATNLFHITQTDAKMKSDHVQGQMHAEATAKIVGKKIRDTIKEIGGKMPEELPAHEDSKIVHRELRHSGHTLKHASTSDMKELPAEEYPENPDDEESDRSS